MGRLINREGRDGFWSKGQVGKSYQCLALLGGALLGGESNEGVHKFAPKVIKTSKWITLYARGRKRTSNG